MTGYAHTLELDPDRGTAHDRMGEVLWSRDRHDEAVNEWRLALQSFTRPAGSRARCSPASSKT